MRSAAPACPWCPRKVKVRQSRAFEIAARPGRYRYLPVFREALRRELSQQDRSDVDRAHRSAEEWFEANGRPEEAIKHAISAKDWPSAARLMATLFSRPRSRPEAARISRWIFTLPRSFLERFPELQVALASSYQILGATEQAEVLLDDLQAAFRREGVAPELGSVIAAIRVALVRARLDLPAARSWWTEIRDATPGHPLAEGVPSALRGRALFDLGAVHM